MDDLEHRLTAALQAEADQVQPRPTGWNGHRVLTGRRGWSAWLAAAAVAALVVLIAVAVARRGGPSVADPPVAGTGTATPSTATTSVTGQSCDGGWTAFGTPVNTGSRKMILQETALLRFAGGRPGATLCASILVGNDTTATGTAELDGSGVGYVATTSSGLPILFGAFGDTVTSLTIRTADNPEPVVTLSASTGGVTDMGNGWHSYAVLLPSRSVVVTVVATGPDGRRIGERQLSAMDGMSTAEQSKAPTTSAASSRSAPTRPSSTVTTALSSSFSCGGQLALPVPGVSATVVPRPAGGWQFRLTNATTADFAVDTLHGYAEVVSDGRSRVESISQDPSYVFRRPTVIPPGHDITITTVGIDRSNCTGEPIAPGDHTMRLILRGNWTVGVWN